MKLIEYTLRYDFTGEGIWIRCAKCRELVWDNSEGKKAETIYGALDEHSRKCYPSLNKL